MLLRGTTWGSMLEATGIERLRPLAALPRTDRDLMNLREAVGDRHFAVSMLGSSGGTDARVIGSDTLPGMGRDILDDAAATQTWIRRNTGLDVWSARQRVVHHVDSPTFVDNAAAGFFGDRAHTFAGPTSTELRDAIAVRDGIQRTASWAKRTAISDLLDEHRLAVSTHEAGHIATARNWGAYASRMQRVAAVSGTAAVEHGLVDEGTADLIAAARLGQRDLGVRDTGRKRHAWRSLDALRAEWSRTPMNRIDVHHGTQLLTAPAVGLLDERGGAELLAEVTGAAVRATGRESALGRTIAPSVPDMANSLLEAAAQRLGDRSPMVTEMQRGWRILGVLR